MDADAVTGKGRWVDSTATRVLPATWKGKSHTFIPKPRAYREFVT